MYVCICNGVTERAVREAAERGARSLSDLAMMTGCGTNCGTCSQLAQQLLDETQRARPLSVPLSLPIYAAAA